MVEDDLFAMIKSLAEELPPDDTFEPIGSLKQILLVIEVLEADISPILDMDCAEQSGVQRRTVVRAVFALIEGLTYLIKQTALEIDDVFERRLALPERMAIKEQVARIDDRGQVQVRTEYPTVVCNVRFAFNMLEKATGSEFELDVGTVGWEALKKSISVRDRITHPKQASDLEIAESEIASLKIANMWFLRSLTTAMLLALRGMAIMRFPDVTAPNKALNSDAPPSGGAPVSKQVNPEE